MRFQNICSIIALSFFSLLSGCAGIQYADKVNAVDITQYDKKEATTTVLAIADEWRNSGAILKKGLKYKITATGQPDSFKSHVPSRL